MSETSFDKWIENHLSYLPGNECPEKWMLHSLIAESADNLAGILQIDKDNLRTIIEQASCMPTHQELHYISEKTGLKESQILVDIVRQIHVSGDSGLTTVVENIKKQLDTFEG